jgi:hypothetical protein
LGATPAPLSATIAAGSNITLYWTTWTQAHWGPVINYLAKCPGDCSTVDKTTLRWVKVDASGLVASTPYPGKSQVITKICIAGVSDKHVDARQASGATMCWPLTTRPTLSVFHQNSHQATMSSGTKSLRCMSPRRSTVRSSTRCASTFKSRARDPFSYQQARSVLLSIHLPIRAFSSTSMLSHKRLM